MAYAQAEAICWLVMGLAAVISLFALGFRSQRIAIVAMVVLLAATIFFRPWLAFADLGAAAKDPDAVFWKDQGMAIALGWEWIWVGGVLALAVIYRRNIAKSERENLPR